MSPSFCEAWLWLSSVLILIGVVLVVTGLRVKKKNKELFIVFSFALLSVGVALFWLFAHYYFESGKSSLGEYSTPREDPE